MSEYSNPRKASSERDLSSLSHLLPFLGSYALSEISPKLIYEYNQRRRSEGASPCTINRELALIKYAFNMAIREWEWIRENPVKKISMEKENPSRDRWLSLEEEERLLAASPQWLKEIITFAIETGCRREEILSLTWKDVDIFKKVVTIFAKKTGDRRNHTFDREGLRCFEVKGKGEDKERVDQEGGFCLLSPGQAESKLPYPEVGL